MYIVPTTFNIILYKKIEKIKRHPRFPLLFGFQYKFNYLIISMLYKTLKE